MELKDWVVSEKSAKCGTKNWRILMMFSSVPASNSRGRRSDLNFDIKKARLGGAVFIATSSDLDG
jgi:hypothetical protein